MKHMLVILVLFSLSACQLTGGQTNYTLEPIVLNGETVCCKVHVLNSKDYDSLKFKLVKSKDGMVEVELVEKGVSASDPAKVMSLNQGKMLDLMKEAIPKNN